MSHTFAPGQVLRSQAAFVLLRARALPVGPERNELRQIAASLIWLEKKGLADKVVDKLETLKQQNFAHIASHLANPSRPRWIYRPPIK